MPEAQQWLVGWKAYGWLNSYTPVLVAIGRDKFIAISQESAQSQAVRKVPDRIGLPGVEIGIRYARVYDRNKDTYVDPLSG